LQEEEQSDRRRLQEIDYRGGDSARRRDEAEHGGDQQSDDEGVGPKYRQPLFARQRTWSRGGWQFVDYIAVRAENVTSSANQLQKAGPPGDEPQAR
jgi:hypothetical protein